MDNVSTDSTLLCKNDSLHDIFIGEKITPFPLSSQIYHKYGDLNYILLDKNELCIFDYFKGTIKNKILINSSEGNGCGILNNYSGFYYHSPDSIFIYNYKLKTVFLIDSLSNVKKKWETKRSDLAKYPVDIEALTPSPIININEHILLSGSETGQPDDATETNKPVSCIIDLNNDSVKYGVGYPQQYRDGNFGGLYFNSIYHTNGSLNQSVAYSFPADHNIYLYKRDFSEPEKLFAGSRYIKSISSSTSDFVDLFSNKEKRIKYYVSQSSYKNIIYDRYRDLYYRIAQTPLYDWKASDMTFIKPFSIIVINAKDGIISETPILENYQMYNLYNIHVIPEGLIIQKNTEDKNVISFELFKIKKI
jgi:hypothetical protein